MELQALLEKAEPILRQAGELVRAIPHPAVYSKEGHANFVTEADMASQQFLMEHLSPLLPEARFFAEEQEENKMAPGWNWVIDPIDGTTNFIRGYRPSSISVGLVKDGVGMLGIVLDPFAGELFSAVKGGGAFRNGEPIHVADIPLENALVAFGTAPYYQELKDDKRVYAKSFFVQYSNTDPVLGKRLVEPYYGKEFVVQNPPAKPLTQEEMDEVYALPYMRNYHPCYEADGGIPAIREIKFSLISNRGCFGACSFCALTFHQGRIIQARSHESLVEEAKLLTEEPDFKGYIHDVGGPTANFRFPACEKQLTKGACPNRQCLFPEPCKNIRADHSDYISLLRKLRSIPKVKKVFIRSGIRFDYVLADKNRAFLRELCEYHVSGQLKVAPEHVADAVLKRMGKPQNSVYMQFVREYKEMNKKIGKEQYLVPYLMSSHPGSTLKEAVELAEYLRDLGYMPEQVQDFYPTPSTLSTCMYYTGLDPRTMEEVYTPHNPHEKAMQRALIQYRNPKNYDLVKEALIKAGRTDLIGFDKKCLIRPREMSWAPNGSRQGQKSGGASPVGKKAAGNGSAAFRNAGKPVGTGKSEASRPAKKKTIRNVHKKK